MDREPEAVSITFVVRLASRDPSRLRGVVERVKTGRKEPVESVEDIGRVIAAALREEEEV